MRSVLHKSILLIFLFAGFYAKAQVKFSASISPEIVGKDEYVELKLIVENAREVQQIVPPALKDFIVISGPNQESGMTMINGVVKKYVALTFILKPRAVGNFIIPGALAQADAGDYKSNPVKVKVTAKSTSNSPAPNAFSSPFASFDPFAEPVKRPAYNDYILRKGENPQEKIKKNMFVQLEVDKKNCYVGEPVVASYKLYTRLKSESNMVKNPSFNGFSVLDLQQPNDLNYHIEKFEGREYNVYTIRKVQLYPLLPGNLELGVAEIVNNVRFIKAEYVNRQPDIFDELFNDLADAGSPVEGIENVKATLQSKPLTILVKPLPDVNKPAGFKGAVGNFDIAAKAEKEKFSTDDAGKIAIIIAGGGNLQLINAPQISWPQGIEGFDSKATDDLFKGTVPVSGRKIFEFAFTVSKPGNYTLPAVEFSFFDIKVAKYKTITTQPINITITKGLGRPEKILAETKSKSSGNYLTRFFSNRLRVVSLFAVLIIIGLIVWLKRDTKKEIEAAEALAVEKSEVEKEEEPVEILPEQVNPLALAEECLQREDANLFYTQLNLGLKNYLAKKLTIPAAELNRKNIAEQLDIKGVSNETAVKMQVLLDEVEWQLYTPFVDTSKMKWMYDQANELVQLINTYRS